GTMRNGDYVRVAGAVICRQRPGTAKGFVFLSLEDETGISNVIITPDVFEQNRFTIVGGKFVLVEGRLQNVDNVISVKTARIEVLSLSEASVTSHDFHCPCAPQQPSISSDCHSLSRRRARPRRLRSQPPKTTCRRCHRARTVQLHRAALHCSAERAPRKTRGRNKSRSAP